MRDNKILSGVLITMLALSTLLGGIPSASAKNILSNTALTNDSNTKYLIAKPTTDVVLAKYVNATSLTDLELVELLKAVGFKGQGLKTAWAVAKAESNGRPFAFNGNIKTGDSSYGIFQVNMLGELGPDRRDKFALDLNAELFSPVKNAEIVFHMTKGGVDWSAWKDAKPLKYRIWLTKFPKNVKVY